MDSSLYERAGLCYNECRMNIVWTIGDLVRKLRGEMTQEALGELAELDKATINRFEMRSSKAKQATTAQIAKVLGTTPHDMGTYVEALNLANQIAQLGPTGRNRVKNFLDALAPDAAIEPPVVLKPARGSTSLGKASTGGNRATARKSRGA